MTELALRPPHIPANSPAALANVRELEANLLALPQVPIATQHVLHAGLYARTIMVPAGTVLTAALIRIPTVLLITGDTVFYLDGEPTRLTGHHVLPASAGRKAALVTIADTWFTMMFATAATTVEQAEREFTDEFDGLVSRRGDSANHVIVTGES